MNREKSSKLWSTVKYSTIGFMDKQLKTAEKCGKVQILLGENATIATKKGPTFGPDSAVEKIAAELLRNIILY